MHAAEWTLTSAALARITSLGLDTASPCKYCGKQVKDIRKHLRSCVPVFQSSLAALVVTAQERAVGAPDLARDGAGGKSHTGQAGGGSGLPDQVDQREDGGHPQPRQEKDGSTDGRRSGTAKTRARDTRKADTSFVIYVDISPHSCLQSIRDAATNWEELFANGKVTMALKTALTMGMPWIHQEQVSNSGASGPPLTHHDPEGSRPGHPLPLDGRDPAALQVYEVAEQGPGGRGRAIHDDDQHEDPGSRRPAQLLGLRVKPERGQRSQLSKQLEQSYLSQDFCEWKARWGDRGKGSA